MKPSRRNSAVLVCGIPLPRALGKYRDRRMPVTSAPTTGITSRRQAAPPAGIEPGAQILGEQNKRHHHQAHDRADDQRKHQQDLVFVTSCRRQGPRIANLRQHDGEENDREEKSLRERRRPVSRPWLCCYFRRRRRVMRIVTVIALTGATVTVNVMVAIRCLLSPKR